VGDLTGSTAPPTLLDRDSLQETVDDFSPFRVVLRTSHRINARRKERHDDVLCKRDVLRKLEKDTQKWRCSLVA